MGGTDVTEITRRCVATEYACADGILRLAIKPVVLACKHRVRMKIDPSNRRQRKAAVRSGPPLGNFRILPEQDFYEDLYLTEHPYGFVSGVATDLPDND